ncbi:hypothetical protein HQ447_04005 [bacterium]|nr:hypothetical protein [bacterium]
MNLRRLVTFPATLSLSLAAEFTPVAERPEIQSPAITEASGLAISPTHPGFMWVVNDSGGTPEIHLLGTDGSDRGKVMLKGVKNVDWEDLASFTFEGKPYLLVADTGDNSAKRETRVFHIIREPALPAAGKKLAGSVLPAWQIPFRYAGGPRDCESVAVDAKAGKILFISKRSNPPELYELPLRAAKDGKIQTAHPICPVGVNSPAGDLLPFANQPTGLDLSADGSLAAVITYYGVFLFPRAAAESWAEAFSRNPVALPPHQLGQAESVAFSKDGKTIFALSEGRKSPIARYQME